MTASTRTVAAPLIAAIALALGACAGSPQRTAGDARSVTPQGMPALPAGGDVSDPRVQARFDAALKRMREGEREAALADFQQLSRDFPQLAGPLVNLGILHAQAGRRGEALSALSRAVVINPRNAVAHNWLGSLYREGGDFARAEQAYRRAVEAQPDYAVAWRNLGILYEVSMRRPREALEAYREYQRRSGGEGAIVVAWIRNLEASVGIAVAGARP